MGPGQEMSRGSCHGLCEPLIPGEGGWKEGDGGNLRTLSNVHRSAWKPRLDRVSRHLEDPANHRHH